MKKNKGFTLIELLVVIAIIGILASVVLASLNSARNKGADAAVKSTLANARAQAEIFYDSNDNSYNTTGAVNSTSNRNVCSITADAGSATTGIMGINKHVLAAAKATGIASTVTIGGNATATTAVCDANGQKWVATAPLKVPSATNNVYCVDSSGFSGEVPYSNVTSSGLSCN